MSRQDSTAAVPDPDGDEANGSNGLSRRRLLRGAAGLGAAGLTTGIVIGSAPAATAAATPVRTAATHEPAIAGPGEQPVVAHVRDPRTGAIDLYVGTRHVQLTDPGLAARLTNAVR